MGKLGILGALALTTSTFVPDARSAPTGIAETQAKSTHSALLALKNAMPSPGGKTAVDNLIALAADGEVTQTDKDIIIAEGKKFHTINNPVAGEVDKYGLKDVLINLASALNGNSAITVTKTEPEKTETPTLTPEQVRALLDPRAAALAEVDTSKWVILDKKTPGITDLGKDRLKRVDMINKSIPNPANWEPSSGYAGKAEVKGKSGQVTTKYVTVDNRVEKQDCFTFLKLNLLPPGNYLFEAEIEGHTAGLILWIYNGEQQIGMDGIAPENNGRINFPIAGRKSITIPKEATRTAIGIVNTDQRPTTTIKKLVFKRVISEGDTTGEFASTN